MGLTRRGVQRGAHRPDDRQRGDRQHPDWRSGTWPLQPLGLTMGDPYTNQVLVNYSPARSAIAVIDAATDRVHILNVAPAHACGRALAFPGGFWIDDTIRSFDSFRYDSASNAIPPTPGRSLRTTAITALVFTATSSTPVKASAAPTDVMAASSVKRAILATGSRYGDCTVRWSLAFLPQVAAGDVWIDRVVQRAARATAAVLITIRLGTRLCQHCGRRGGARLVDCALEHHLDDGFATTELDSVRAETMAVTQREPSAWSG